VKGRGRLSHCSITAAAMATEKRLTEANGLSQFFLSIRHFDSHHRNLQGVEI
jgi:hypothetical protein